VVNGAFKRNDGKPVLHAEKIENKCRTNSFWFEKGRALTEDRMHAQCMHTTPKGHCSRRSAIAPEQRMRALAKGVILAFQGHTFLKPGDAVAPMVAVATTPLSATKMGASSISL
jgi:hypothetical protein